VIKMSFGDRMYITIALLVIMGLLWLRYVDDYLWVPLVLWIILAVVINKFGK